MVSAGEDLSNWDDPSPADRVVGWTRDTRATWRLRPTLMIGTVAIVAGTAEAIGGLLRVLAVDLHGWEQWSIQLALAFGPAVTLCLMAAGILLYFDHLTIQASPVEPTRAAQQTAAVLLLGLAGFGALAHVSAALASLDHVSAPGLGREASLGFRFGQVSFFLSFAVVAGFTAWVARNLLFARAAGGKS